MQRYVSMIRAVRSSRVPFRVDDPDSGDSRNKLYRIVEWSLHGHYSDIYGTTEKMNTEFGFDAPPCIDDLKKMPPVYRRLQLDSG